MASDLNAEAYLRQARREIALWEKSKESYFTRIGNFALNPAAKLASNLVPTALQTAASAVIERTLSLTADASKFSVDAPAITLLRAKRIGRKRSLGERLKPCDGLARSYWRSHCGYAAAEGAATGLIGLAGLVADLPLILSIAIREIRSMALCYGYSPAGAIESDYALHILRLGSSTAKTKTDTLMMLKKIEKRPRTVTETEIEKVKHLVSLQEYSKSLATELLQRRMLQLLPLVGVVTAASFNAAYANEVGRAAYMCYRRRFIQEQLTSSEVENQGFL